ncbi:cytochrome P450, partial [Caulochytrium protostelioides]
PKNVAYVLKDNYDNFVKGGTFKTSLGELLGEGIFVSDGEVHRQQRKTTAGIFTGNTFRGVITDGLFEELDLLIGLMDRWSASGEAFDFSKVMHALTMNLFGKVGFRRDFRLLERFPEEIPFTSAFDDADRTVSCRFSNPLFRLTEWWSGEGERLRDNIRTIDAFAYDCIAEHRARHRPHAQASVAPPHADGSREPTVSAQHRDLLDMFMACRNPDRTPWSDVQLRDMLLNTIIAGRDTTAQALAWAMYELQRHPA